MLAELLETAGYAVVQASDGSEGLSRLREARPDLIVLDLMLPGMSGWQFLDRSRAELERANIPVIILSAIKGESDYPSTLGVATWLTKPIDEERFLSAVAGLAEQRQRSGAARVLVVEDEDVVRELIVNHLAEDGFRAESAASVSEARARLEASRPDLIVLDLMLDNGQSGWTFLRERTADPDLASIPVLVVSAAPRDRLVEAKELGADAFLSKPFDLDALSTLARGIAR